MNKEMTSFHQIVIWAFILSSIHVELEATCLKTICDCYDDEYFGLVEYQCPNRAKSKVVIRVEENRDIEVICMDKLAVGNILPKYIFSYESVTIERCIISEPIANVFNITNIKTMKIENSIIPEDFLQYMFSIPLPRLERLSLKATQTKNFSFQHLNAPNLFFIDFENLEYQLAAKMVSNLTQIEILNFMNNEIYSVGSNDFGNLTSLRELHMMFNSIENINNGAFRYLEKLKILNLGNNNIRFISRDVLKPLRSLYHVTLEGNNGLSLDDYLFANFSKLSVVHLGTSDLSSIPENIFSGSTSISEIFLDYNNICVIPKRLFEGLINLKSLDMKFNKILSLDGALKGLVNLETLELNNNKITTLTWNDFSGLGRLVDLNLNCNNISTIHDNTFRSNVNLERLHLYNNSYEYELINGRFFTKSPFSKCVKLEFLDLGFNRMKDVPDDLFLNARYLKYLNLEGNRIEILDLEYIHKWNIAFKGVNINLKYNDIRHFFFDQYALGKIDPDYELEEHEFGGGDSTNIDGEDSRKPGPKSVISLSQTLKCDCYVESMSEFYKTADSGIFLDLNQLICDGPGDIKGKRFVDVPATQFTCDISSVTENHQCTNSVDCSCFWRPYDKTIIVNCSSNNITTAPVINAPTDLTYQKIEVHLEGNLLKDLIEVEGYENVTNLFLASNHINNITWIPPNIEMIDLSYNNLTVLPYSVLDMLSGSVKNIKLGNNPWSCDCDNNGMPNFLRKYISKMIDLSYNNLTVLPYSVLDMLSGSVKNIKLGNNPWSCDCDNNGMPNFLRKYISKVDAQNIKYAISGLKMHTLNKEDICDETRFHIIIVLLIFCPIIVFLILVVFFYKYKKEIKVWLYARNLCMRFLVEEDLDEHKEYDVFVSYSQKDGEFVEKILVPILEDTPFHYKLCLHYRDWIPGTFITENIANSVTKSRRTLIVFSPNFLDSIWGKMEFRTAHANAMRERRNRVVLLLKEDIDTEKLDDELKSYISTNTYIKWEDPWFWKKLRYALPHITKTP